MTRFSKAHGSLMCQRPPSRRGLGRGLGSLDCKASLAVALLVVAASLAAPSRPTTPTTPSVSTMSSMMPTVWFAMWAIGGARGDEPIQSALNAVEQASEEEAYAIALEAYVYGYPRVELARRIHNETNRVSADQVIYAPANQFYFFGRLARPGDGRAVKAPNNDTLYASAFLDLAQGPIILSVPPMERRLYVALLVDATGAVVQRLSSTASGPGGVAYAFMGPGSPHPLPAGLSRIAVAGNDLWMLMRVATDGTPDDERLADALLRRFQLQPLSGGSKPQSLAPPRAGVADQRQGEVQRSAIVEPLKPFGTMAYFHVLARMLERNPMPAADRGMLARWERIGLRAGDFAEAGLAAPVRRGLERAIAQGEKIVAAAQFGIAIPVNGWNYSLKVGRTGTDWALRAAIARGGYGNLPEDSVYYQRSNDAKDQPLTGERRYTLTFPPGKLPPVRAFWSLTAYDMATFDLIENSAKRYSIGDRTKGVVPNADGSLTIYLQREAPASELERANWLPVGDRPFYLIIRTYDPAPEIFEGRWAPPQLRSR